MRRSLKGLLLVIVTISIFVSSFTFVNASTVADKFVQKEIQVFDGIYLEAIGKPTDNYRKLGVVLDNSIDIGTNDFLSIKFRNLSGANIPISITLDDNDGNLLNTNYTGSETDYKTHYYIPENTNNLQTVKEYNGCVNMKSDITGGELLVNISSMTKTGNRLIKIAKIFIGIPAAYNVGEKIELLEIQLVDSEEFIYSESNGFSIPTNEIIESFLRTNVYDFTKIESQLEFENLCKNYKLLKCNKENAITKSFDKYVLVGKAEIAQGVLLDGDCVDGIKFSLKSQGTYVSDLANDKFGYIRLANLSSNPIVINDALAIKMSAVYNNSAFRIIIVEKDGEAWQAGASKGQFVFAATETDISYMQTYYNCIWPSKKEGTLVIPYSSLKYLENDSVAINNTENDKVLTDIAEIYLAMDMAESSKEAKNRKIAIANIADINFLNKEIKTIADLTTYSVSSQKEIKADANFASADKSIITTPCSTNLTTNANWVLGKATMMELASKLPILNQYVGDVKILDNFKIQDNGYTKEEKDEIISSFYSTYGEVSYLAYSELGDGTPALEWKIGNYVNEYQNVSGGYCGLTIDPVADASEWANWQNAKGMTLRIKNPHDRPVSFNIAFQQKLNGETIAYRMNYSNAPIYALDCITLEEFSFRTGSVSSFSSGPTIYLPSNFDGWIRIDFSSFGKYSALGPDEIDFTNDVIALKITSFMLDNSDLRIIFGNVGVYYDNFDINWSFDNSGKTMADCLNGGSNE